MSIQSIKRNIELLRQQWASKNEPLSLRDKITRAYEHHILTQLERLLSEPDEISLSGQLENFLHTNWFLVKGTCLSYTAIPESDVVKLLYDVAVWVAHEKDRKGCFMLHRAIPPSKLSDIPFGSANSVCIRVKETERIFPRVIHRTEITAGCANVILGRYNVGYVRVHGRQNGLYHVHKERGRVVRLALSKDALAMLDKQWNDCSELNAEVLNILRNLSNHPKVENALYYANQQKDMVQLQVTVNELKIIDQRADIHLSLLDPLASCYAPLAEVVSLCHPLKLLMPSISLVAYRDDYSDLPFYVDILKTHILDDKGQTLIPVQLLTEIPCSPERVQLRNPYDENAYLDDVDGEVFRRLTQHSVLCRSVWEAKQTVEKLTTDTSNLLGQLNTLCRLLRLYDVSSGLGTEENAAGGAYPAIIHFMEYYQQLDDSEQGKIPLKLKQEIELLFKLVTDPHKNIDATVQLETCIATRGMALRHYMLGHELVLSDIGIVGDKKASLILKANLALEEAKVSLKHVILSNQYEGKDDLSITKALMSSLNVNFDMALWSDLVLFHGLSVAEIHEFCLDQEFRNRVIYAIGSIDNLIILIMELSSDKARAVLEGLQVEIMMAYIDRPIYLSAFLISFDVDKCQLILESLHEQLMKIIHSGRDYEAVLKNLTVAQRTIIYEFLKNKLLHLISSGDDFGRILHFLTHEQRSNIYVLLKNKVFEVIRSGDDLARAMCYLNTEQRMELFDTMDSALPEMIRSVDEFARVIHYVTQNKRMPFFHSLKNNLLNMVQSSSHLAQVLRYFTPSECRVVCLFFQNQWPIHIRNGEDIILILHCLELEQCRAVCETLKDQFVVLISPGRGFSQVLSELPHDKCQVLCEALSDQLAKLIQLFEMFSDVMHYGLTREHRKIILESLRDRWPQIINSGHKFITTLHYLTKQQRAIVFDALIGQFPRIIRSCDDFSGVLPYLTTEQRSILFASVKSKLFAYRDFNDQFIRILVYLNLEQCQFLCDTLVDTCLEFIPSVSDFRRMLQALVPVKRSIVFRSWLDKLSEIITSKREIELISCYLTREEQRVLQQKIIEAHGIEQVKPILNCLTFGFFAHVENREESPIMKFLCRI